MSKVRADNFTNRAADGAPTFTNGVVVTGVATVTGGASFGGSVSIGGTLTYEDVTNVDSVGLITANNGITILSGGLKVQGGLSVASGITTLNNTNAADITTGILTSTETRFKSVSESIKVGTGTSVTIDFDSGDGNIGYVGSPSGAISLYVNDIPTTSFNRRVISLTVIVMQGAVGNACTSVYFNGISKNIVWSGGSVPGAATSCIDYYNFVGIDTIGDGSISSYVVTGNSNGDYRFY